MKLNKKPIIWISGLLILLLLGWAAFSLVNRFTAAGQSLPEMMVAVERGDLEIWITGSGTVKAAHEEVVRTRLRGTVETFLPEDGEAIAAGDKLATLELQDYSVQIKKAEIELERLAQELENLEEEETVVEVIAPGSGTITWLVRKGDWVQRGAAVANIQPAPIQDEGGESGVQSDSAIEVIVVRAPGNGTIVEVVDKAGVVSGFPLAKIENLERSTQIEQQIELKELQIEKARLDLADLQQEQQDNRKYSIITAPISGTVVLPEQGGADVGVELPQGTVLATIIDYSRLEVTIPVDELDINKVKIGQQAKLSVDALPGLDIAGEVIRISPKGKSQAGVATFDVTISVVAVEGLRVGMNISASILVERRLNTLLLPLEALFELDGKTMVMAALEEGEGGANEPRPVEVVTGLHDATFIEIVSGVREGQTVIIQDPVRAGDPREGMMFGPGMGQEGNGQ